jgi:hypothetical protein
MATLPETLIRRTVHGVHQLTIARAARGWELRREFDGQLEKVVQYQDWHRVEAAMQSFERGDFDRALTVGP